ncbi:GNAT family N-acetyltransferase [Streptomyces salyersiae]|uniref:GNAT family N-acetyltransferase n=1 Tax=Streptomyces salyersiae TaxID=3075530 RepID=A0ABU2REN6_9ACTN|nr:GNAT family N-acetyltransferase [Streptomyces sp. DSM 41770]MDT0426945.1 GNAT family N-acetyltransferase [Streptomyces sp. DSM 41770]
MDIARDAEARRSDLGAGGAAVHVVATGPDSTVTGWACYGPCRDDTGYSRRSELYALYVRPGHIGTGTGRTLLTAVTDQAAADGFAGRRSGR